MAFFSNPISHDPQLRRKRSTSTNNKDRPSRQSAEDKCTDESSSHKRSPRISALPSTSAITLEPHDPAPPLPTPVTAALESPSGTAGRRDDASPSSYDQSSTPVPFTKSTKRPSPPPFSSLVIDVPKAVEQEYSSSPCATPNHPENISTISSGTAPSSPSVLSPILSSSPVKHAYAPPEEFSSGLISPSMSRVELQRPPFSQRIAAVLPLKLPHSPIRTTSSDIGPNALPTPVSPFQGRGAVRPEPIPIPLAPPLGQPHTRSQTATNSPTAYAPGSGPGPAKSSARRSPSPVVNLDIGDPSYPRPASASGKSTPSHDTALSKPREKRSRNVLRKRSITGGSRNREPESAPASDSEKKTNTHRPRSRSVVFPSRRDTRSPKQDILQPLPGIPVTAVDLTPAKEILVAYKESHRDSFSEVMPLPNSGMMVVVGLEEENNASSLTGPWSSLWKAGRKDNGRAEERDPGEKSGTGLQILRRKLSSKRSGKDLSKRRDNPTRSVSESAVEISERKLIRDTEANWSATISNDTRFSGSPTSGQSPRRGSRPRDEGHVWEEDVGNKVGKYLGDTQTETEEKDVSNSRRLWKLVKRLSSGNLREKANPPLEPPPPVPPLPKDLSRKRDMCPSAVHDFHAGEMPIPQTVVPETPGGIRRFITSVPSVSIPHLVTDSGQGAKQTSFHHRRSELDSGADISPITSRMNSIYRSVNTGTAIQMRRTATTRSSSPSSETTKFFSRSRSSSSSSYGDAIAPPMPSIPPAHTGKHTSSREHHSSHNDKGEDTVAIGRSPSAKTSTASSPRSSDETSPTIPPFEAYHPINKFLPYRKRSPLLSPCTTSHFPDQDPIIPRTEAPKCTSPPPIPKRNPRRPGHHSVSILSLPAPQHSKLNIIPVRDSNESDGADGNTLRSQHRFDSGQTPSTPKPRPRSTSDGAIIPEPERYANTAKSTSTFREMRTAQRHLTEQEKNAKWEDLLQRSDEAGGTLHVGPPISGGLRLWSDRSSVALSEVLDSTD